MLLVCSPDDNVLYPLLIFEILLGSALSALVYPKGPYIGAPSNAQPMIGECNVGSEKSNLSLGGPSNVNFLAILL